MARVCPRGPFSVRGSVCGLVQPGVVDCAASGVGVGRLGEPEDVGSREEEQALGDRLGLQDRVGADAGG